MFLYGFVVGAPFWIGLAVIALYLYGHVKKWPAFADKLVTERREEFNRGKREGLACAMHAMGFIQLPSAALDDQEKLVFARIAELLEDDDDDAVKH